MDYSLPGSSIHGILQARILEWVPFPSPGDLPNPGIEPRSSALQADSLLSETQGKPSKIYFNKSVDILNAYVCIFWKNQVTFPKRGDLDRS